jgi:hypothetical protein
MRRRNSNKYMRLRREHLFVVLSSILPFFSLFCISQRKTNTRISGDKTEQAHTDISCLISNPEEYNHEVLWVKRNIVSSNEKEISISESPLHCPPYGIIEISNSIACTEVPYILHGSSEDGYGVNSVEIGVMVKVRKELIGQDFSGKKRIHIRGPGYYIEIRRN